MFYVVNKVFELLTAVRLKEIKNPKYGIQRFLNTLFYQYVRSLYKV